MIADSVEFLHGHGRRVLVDMEHFFDGFKDNPEFSFRALEAAVVKGASHVVLCDTNGGSLPHEIDEALVIQDWLRRRRGDKVILKVPRRGHKRDLVEMAAENAAETLSHLRAQWLLDEGRQTTALGELQALAGSLLAASYIGRVLTHAFTKVTQPAPPSPIPPVMEWTALGMAVLAVGLGFAASWGAELLRVGAPAAGSVAAGGGGL